MAELHVETFDGATAMAAAAAAFVAERARTATADHQRFAFAVSGGHTPWAMFLALRDEDMPWSATSIFQVDERVAPEGDPDRNLTHLRDSLRDDRTAGVQVHPMPVEDPSLEEAAARYAADLPERFDLVHLGLGPDGHTASLVPGDPVLEVRDRSVALTDVYQGRRRMTLTYPVLDAAADVVWLVAGADKVDALARLRAGDASIPAGRIRAERQVVFADRPAAGGESTNVGV